MICEVSDGDLGPRESQVPRYVRLEMYEGKYGFLLKPICRMTGQRVEIERIRIPKSGQTLLRRLFAGQETWQVQVWEYADGHHSVTPTWTMTFDPDTTREEAQRKADAVIDMYAHWDERIGLAKYFRTADPLMRLAPRKPPARLLQEDPLRARELLQEYEIEREERAARFKVLSAILPKTVELAERAEQVEDFQARRVLEGESLEAYFAENAPGWSSILFKAWQHLNPVGFKWVQWLYIWHSRNMVRRKEIDPVDFELAFNWRWKEYYSLTAEQLRDAVFRVTVTDLIGVILFAELGS